MKRLILLALLIPSVLAAQRDTTVCTAFRTRTSVNGSILSTSVTKVLCGGSTKTDTVKVPGPTVHDTVTKHDTVTVNPTPAPVPVDPRGYNCWARRDETNQTCIPDAQAAASSQVTVLRRYGQTFGYVQWMWRGVIYPSDPSLPGPGTVIHDTVTVPVPGPTVHDTVKVPVPGPRDTVYLPTPAPNSRTPELPRTTVDTRMPDMPLSGDTLYQVNSVWWCRGPSCQATLASHGLPVQIAPAPPIPAGSSWILTGKNQTPPLAKPKTTPKKPATKKPIKEPVG